MTSETQTDGSTVYTAYGRNGQVTSQTIASGELSPVYSAGGGTVAFPNGEVLYVGIDGAVHTVSGSSLTPYAQYGRAAQLSDDCYVASDGEGLNVFDGDGKYRRTVTYESLFDIPANAEETAWMVGSRFFVQYTYAVPDDERDYDYYSGGTKYCMETFWYDIASDSEGSADLKYVVVETAEAHSNGDCAVLHVIKILDNKQLSSQSIIQAFNNGGGIHLDLQSLLPGADDIRVEGKGVVLSDGAVENYYYDNSLICTLPADTLTYPMHKYFVAGRSIYSASDKVEFTLSEEQNFVSVTGGNAYYQTTVDGRARSPFGARAQPHARHPARLEQHGRQLGDRGGQPHFLRAVRPLCRGRTAHLCGRRARFRLGEPSALPRGDGCVPCVHRHLGRHGSPLAARRPHCGLRGGAPCRFAER